MNVVWERLKKIMSSPQTWETVIVIIVAALEVIGEARSKQRP